MSRFVLYEKCLYNFVFASSYALNPAFTGLFHKVCFYKHGVHSTVAGPWGVDCTESLIGQLCIDVIVQCL